MAGPYERGRKQGGVFERIELEALEDNPAPVAVDNLGLARFKFIGRRRSSVNARSLGPRWRIAAHVLDGPRVKLEVDA